MVRFWKKQSCHELLESEKMQTGVQTWPRVPSAIVAGRSQDVNFCSEWPHLFSNSILIGIYISLLRVYYRRDNLDEILKHVIIYKEKEPMPNCFQSLECWNCTLLKLHTWTHTAGRIRTCIGYFVVPIKRIYHTRSVLSKGKLVDSVREVVIWKTTRGQLHFFEDDRRQLSFFLFFHNSQEWRNNSQYSILLSHMLPAFFFELSQKKSRQWCKKKKKKEVV